MNIISKEIGKYMHIKIVGRIDTSNYEVFSDELQVFIDEGRKFLILDLEGLEYISSSGLRIFLKVLKSLRAVEGDVVLCCLNNKIKSVFEISGFLSFFNLADNIDSI
jgi:anti-anti-sigma factor